MDFSPFNQPAPELDNQYDSDAALRAYLARALPRDVLSNIEPELREMGQVAADLAAEQLADRLNEPVLTTWSAWGERIDHIEVSPLWKKAARIAAERGVVATAYERKHGRFSRVHQFALAYLFNPSTDIYSCPLAMTDGAAHTLVKSGNSALVDRAVGRLTSRDPDHAWTSGQWMTESTGGSDVGQSETVARQDPDGTWRLWGRKWFTSAATGQMTLTLGRPEGNGPGGEGLALFYVETRDEAGRLRNIEINRLKDKLGTRKVPTAELMLRGTPAELVTEPAGGIRNIAPMLNVTRTWNAVMSASGMRRGIALARDYAGRRVAFKQPLSEKPLHRDTLAAMQAELEGALQLSFFVAELLGRDETGELDEHHGRLLRLLTPLAKLTTAKQAVSVASEALECFGGAGYVEDTGLPTLLRDAQVLPIWEGTTNVLSLDALRAMAKDPGVLEALRREAADAVGAANAGDHPRLARAGQAALAAIDHATAWVQEAAGASPRDLEAGARRFALTLGRSFELALLIRQAAWSLEHDDRRPAAAALRFATHGIDLIETVDPDESSLLA
jgi:alkylation response protein AidB-like acyl-CoA dehydrogenase